MKNDPKLTAWILGELSGDEATEIGRIVEADPELRDECDRIRELVAEIEQVMQKEPIPEKPTGTTVVRTDATVPKRSRGALRYVVAGLSGLIAASIIAALVLPAGISPRPDYARTTESSTPTPPPVIANAEKGERAKNDSVPPEVTATVSVPDGGTVLMGGIVLDGSGIIRRSTTTRGREDFRMMVEPRIIIQEEEEEYIVQADQYDRNQTAAFKSLPENHFLRPQDAPLSTFSIDVDTASYTLMRRNLNEFNRLPPRESVRIEEYINYFSYKYEQPKDEKPFAAHVEVSSCPWNGNNLLAKIGIKGREVSREERPALNLVFLVDVSGSMSGSNRLPLVKRGLTELVEMLEERDRVAIVTYANDTNIVLPSVSGREGRAILDSINALNAAGGTAGGDGIQKAYELARKNFNKEAQNRVILCTDGDFNIGITDNAELETLIEKEAKSGVFLSVLGFGMGNIRDDKLKTFSSKGNGNYAYIDNFEEARKVLVDDLTGTLVTIAKDVKLQVDFNPKHVAAYRLIGYENRVLRDRDFNDDTKDAGDIGSGHTVTALYEIVPNGKPIPDPDTDPGVDPSRYAAKEPTIEPEAAETPAVNEEFGNELMFVKIRHKKPEVDKSELSVYPVEMKIAAEISDDFRFASAVALSGMLLRESRYIGTGNFDTVLELARSESTGPDEKYRKEFIELIEKAKELRR